jgi:hypothetical protein
MRSGHQQAISGNLLLRAPGARILTIDMVAPPKEPGFHHNDTTGRCHDESIEQSTKEQLGFLTPSQVFFK